MSAVPETAPELLAPERLAEIRQAMKVGNLTSRGKMGRQLWGHVDAQATELATLRGQLAAAEEKWLEERQELKRAQNTIRDYQQKVDDLADKLGASNMNGERLSALLREAQAAAAKMDARLYRALDALGGMYCQYTPGATGHDFMSAGEDAQDVLSEEKLLDADWNFIGMPLPLGPEDGWIDDLLKGTAPACPSTCTGCEKAADCEPVRPFAELTRPEKLAKVSDSMLLRFAESAEPGSDAHYDIVMEMTARGMTTPIEPATSADAAPIRLGAKIGAAAGSLPSGGEASENGLCFYCKGGIAPGCTCAPTTIEKKGGPDNG